MVAVSLKCPAAAGHEGKNRRTWDAAVTLVQAALNQAAAMDSLMSRLPKGRPMQFVLVPREQIRWTAGLPGSVAVRHVVANAVRLRCKTGDNSTSWEYDLVPPTGVAPDVARMALLQVSEDGASAAEANVRPTESRADDGAKHVSLEPPMQSEVVPSPGTSKAKQQALDTIAVAPELSSLQTPGESMASALVRMTEALKRDEGRKREMASVEQRIRVASARVREIEQELQTARSTQQELEQRLLDLMQQAEDDAELKAVTEFCSVLHGFQSLSLKGAK